MVCKNSKKKNNNLKPVIKTSYKKVNRKQIKKIGGSLWSGIKELVSSPITPVKSKRRFLSGIAITKTVDDKGKLVYKSFTRSSRGKSIFPFRSYKSTSQMRKNLEFGKSELAHHKREYILLDNKLNNYKAKFQHSYDQKFNEFKDKIEKEIKLPQYAGVEGQAKLYKKYKDKADAFKKSKAEFDSKYKNLADKVNEKKKVFDKVKTKYENRIKEFQKKMATKVNTTKSLVSEGARRTCKSSSIKKGCQDAVDKCIGQGLFNPQKLQECMHKDGFIDFTAKKLETNIINAKTIFHRRKIRNQLKQSDKVGKYSTAMNHLSRNILNSSTIVTGIEKTKFKTIEKDIHPSSKVAQEIEEREKLALAKQAEELAKQAEASAKQAEAEALALSTKTAQTETAVASQTAKTETAVASETAKKETALEYFKKSILEIEKKPDTRIKIALLKALKIKQDKTEKELLLLSGKLTKKEKNKLKAEIKQLDENFVNSSLLKY